jgi:hypothetical protein
MSDTPKKKKTFFGRLLKGIGTIGKAVSPNLIGAITDATGLTDVAKLTGLINNEKELTQLDKEILFKELEQDISEMQEVTKRWQSDMQSDSWLSKNVRPLIIIFLTLVMSVYITVDSATDGFNVKEDWIGLLSSLLLLVYGAYFGGRSLEKIQKMRKNK